MTMDVTIRRITGPELIDVLPGLARLRIEIFAGWPYLYEGDLLYESNYLREFSRAPDAVVVGMDTSRLFYFGESVLFPEYRGRKIGHAFFDHREAQARSCGATAAVFAAVVRPETHPHKPEGYMPLDAFWMRRGYRPIETLTTQLSWPERTDGVSTVKTMQYWRRDL